MLPQPLAFIDLETTGLSPTRDRIMEVGIVRVENNKIITTYETLINPQTYLSPYIESMTGITERALQRAPLFADIQEKITELLEGAFFVAHNARFDYGFLYNEFKRCGIKFSSKQICTAKLSRKLFPQEKRHSLESIIERYGFTYERRHRAFDDAHILWQFFQYLQQKIPVSLLEQELVNTLKKPSLPVGLAPDSIETLPEAPGVYLFYGENGVPLYVGKSINIKERVLSHFSSDHSSSKEMQLSQQVRSIETITTSGELGAFIKESALVKKLQPIYNRQLRISRKLVVLKQRKSPEGYYLTSMETVNQMNAEDIQDIVGIFRSQQQAKEFLIVQAQKHHLCEKLLGLEKTKSACFRYRLHTCKGACVQEEKSIAYNMRFIQAFAEYKIKSWGFTGPIVIREKNDKGEESLIVDRWCLVKTISVDHDAVNEKEETMPLFDLDVYKILVRYIYDQKNQKNITVIS
jgi:DNA polymerase III subunit epsilon